MTDHSPRNIQAGEEAAIKAAIAQGQKHYAENRHLYPDAVTIPQVKPKRRIDYVDFIGAAIFVLVLVGYFLLLMTAK